MRHLLLRFLLLTVFFNTAMGLPLHEAAHLRHAAQGAAKAGSPSVTVGERSENSEPGSEHAEGPCTWCAAYAQQAMALTAPPLAQAEVEPPAGFPAPDLFVVFVPSPGRWPFASRDPPHPFA